MKSNEIYEKVNALLFEKIKEGSLPWHKPWSSFGPPCNFITKRPYRGINNLMLSFSNDPYPYYLTFKQAQDLGGFIQKGSKGHLIVFSKVMNYNRDTKKPIDSANLKDISKELVNQIYYLKFSYVFNISCLEGVEVDLPELPTRKEHFFDQHKAATIVAGMKNSPRIQTGEARAYYAPSFDLVNMPVKELFKSPAHYYHTLFHELTHSTGHSSRLNRPGIVSIEGMKAASYSYEELVAEMGACYLSNQTGDLPSVVDNSASYLQGWLEKLIQKTNDDPTYLARAASEAQKAADFINNLSQPSDEVDSDNELNIKEIEV